MAYVTPYVYVLSFRLQSYKKVLTYARVSAKKNFFAFKSHKSKVKGRPSIFPLKGDFNRDYDTG